MNLQTVLSVSGASAELAETLRAGTVLVRTHRGGAGSGTLWQADGLIVTNSHVVSGEDAEVITADEQVYRGRLTARDARHDLALLRVDATGLPALPAADSDLARPGQMVLATGNPWGQRGAVTAGIIFRVGPATEESSVPLPRAIFADVRLAPGNSGGPLANARGEVVGINAMISGGMAVAVPSNVVRQLVSGTLPAPGFIGISGRPAPLSPAIAASTGAMDGAALLLTEIVPGSPAAAAGLIPGDLLLAIDGSPSGFAGVARRLSHIQAGAPASLRLIRGGKVKDVTVTPVTRS